MQSLDGVAIGTQSVVAPADTATDELGANAAIKDNKLIVVEAFTNGGVRRWHAASLHVGGCCPGRPRGTATFLACHRVEDRKSESAATPRCVLRLGWQRALGLATPCTDQ